EASMAVPKFVREAHGFVYLVAASDKHSPVAIPRWATLCCKIMSMMVDKVTIHNRVNPNSEPAAMLAAQLPGSIKPTVTSRPGPMYFSIFKAPNVGRCSLLSRFFRKENIGKM